MKEKGTLFLGKNDGRKVMFPFDKRKKHTHIVGGTGTGKSNFIFNCIIQDIQQGNGLTLIDPHGEFFDRVLNWLAQNKAIAGQRKIKVIDTTEKQLVFNFNPLKHTRGDIAANASYNLAAVMGVWGEDTKDTPRIREVLQNLFISLSAKNMTFVESDIFFNFTLKSQRQELIKDLPNRQYWEDLSLASDREYREEISSARRRINELILTKKMQNILGQTDNTFEVLKAMEREEIVLINLARSDYLEAEQSRMIGCLLINQYFNKAFYRNPKTAKPHFLYVDESANYITGDIEKILVECRKFGLHLILAHNHLGQIKELGEKVYNGIMSQAENKIIFGELSYPDGIELAQHIFKKINFKEAKHIQRTPTVVGYRKELMKSSSKSKNTTKGITQSEARAFADSSGRGTTKATHESTGTGLNYIPDIHGQLGDEVAVSEMSNQGMMSGNSDFSSTTNSESFGKALTDSLGVGETHGTTEALVPIIKDYITSIQFYNLQEQHHRNNEKLRLQQIGEAFVSLQGQALPVKIKVPYEATNETKVQKIQLLKQCFQKTSFVQTQKRAEQILKERKEGLKKEIPSELQNDDFLE